MLSEKLENQSTLEEARVTVSHSELIHTEISDIRVNHI
jgi:hypothetical protein